MATLLKPVYTVRLPANPQFETKDGKKNLQLVVRGRKVLYPVTECGTKYRRQASKWYGQFTDGNGITQRVPLCADKGAAQQKLNELVKRADRQRLGVFDPTEDHAQRPLTDHLGEYRTALAAKGDTADHVAQTVSRIQAILVGCNIFYLRDLEAVAVASWLHTKRLGRTPVVLLADKETFTPTEAANLLGISGTAVRAAVKRHRLAAHGNGKARLLPRATVEALAARSAVGMSPATVNHHIRAIRGFTRWLMRTRRIGSNPLDTLTLVNAQGDVRRARRELTADELTRLLASSRRSPRSFRGLTGEDRYHIYLVAASTGFRARALANLTPADFDLTSAVPTVTLAARFSKSKKTKVQPLPPEATTEMVAFLSSKPVADPLWGGRWAKDKRGAEMLRGDLESVGIPYTVPGPDGPLHADFHALRHAYLTMLGRHGVDLRTAQELAGHSTPTLTARYTHTRLPDLAAAVGRLPSLTTNAGSGGSSGKQTGSPTPALALNLAQTPRAKMPSVALPCTSDQVAKPDGGVTQPLEMKRPGASSHRAASDFASEGDGTRTRNLRIDSPHTMRRMTWKSKRIRNLLATGVVPGVVAPPRAGWPTLSWQRSWPRGRRCPTISAPPSVHCLAP